MAVIIETPRLALRHHEYGDIGELLRIFASPKVNQFYRVGQTSESIRDDLVGQIETRKSVGEERPYFGIWAIYHKEDDRCIGECGLSLLEEIEDIQSEILFEIALNPSCWGKGLALEAATAVRDYCFYELGVEKLGAVVHPDNNPALNLLRSLFMEFEREFNYPAIMKYGFHLYAVETRCWLTDPRSQYFSKLETLLAA